jgi:hypothetical protein
MTVRVQGYFQKVAYGVVYWEIEYRVAMELFIM